MTGSTVAVLVAVGVLSLLGAAVLHAIVAAFEQLPHARERELAHALRPDGKPTKVARWAALDEHPDDAASVAYAVCEAVAIVCTTLVVGAVTQAWEWPVALTVVVAVAIAAASSLVVARAVPRQIARRAPEGSIRVLAGTGWILTRSAGPLKTLLPALKAPPLAEPEDLVEQAQDALEAEDAELLRSVVSLGDTLTREVMVPRTDMITIASGTPARKAMVLFMRSGFSRVPVIGDDIDDTIGVLYLKDVVARTWDDTRALGAPVEDFMREAEFIPESVPVDDLLRRMQDEVFHMAIVVDEFGGVAGLVTIEDALEEIVGEVVDEHDRTVQEVERVTDGVYRIPARMDLDDLAELFDVVIEDEDVETAAGLLAKSLGKVPIRGARASAHGLVLTAERMEGRRRRLTTLLVEAAPEEESDD
ncbi:hemolysin family protein [Demequina sp. B12]|uniref:hemolysin family protein n=1 Tax=Demequina sp. B12 TaxID=2992757 RepID=UPI00237A8CBA|nr:hemolysin family protein [Demequina sp. B12]MDE0572850.1 hemolysin family protein [Demequina sp. B12]